MTPHLLSITFRITTDKGLNLELKKKLDFFLHGRAMHVDCIGMRAISMGRILAHNIGCAIRHPTSSSALEPLVQNKNHIQTFFDP